MSEILTQVSLGEYEFIVYSDRPQIDFFEVKQVHGNKVITCQENSREIESDGLISKDSETMAIKTADCLPVAFVGKKGNALIHAGWRGLENKILLDREIKELEVERILIGPHIGPDSYEVGEEFLDYFDQKHFLRDGDSLYLNLSSIAMEMLQKYYPEAKVENIDICTFKNKNYNSYRRDKTKIRNFNILKRK